MMAMRWGLLVAGLVLGLAGRGLMGCASAGDEEEPRSDDLDSGAGDVATSDVVADVNRPDGDAGADGGLRCSADGWCRTVLPVSELIEAGALDREMPALDVRDVWVSPDRTAWAVTMTGHLLRWHEGAWSVAFDAGGPLRSVWGAGTSDLWIAGEQGLLLHGSDKGTGMTFERIPFDESAAVLRVWGTSPWDVWVVSSQSVHRYSGKTEGGRPIFSEVRLPDPQPDRVHLLTDIWGANGELWVGGLEHSSCAPNCPSGYRSTTVVFKWRGDVAPADDASTVSWDRVAVQHPKINPSASAMLVAGAGAIDGTQLAHVTQGSFNGVLRVATADAGTLDASAAIDAGDYVQTMEVALSYGRPTGLWATTSDDVWLIASPGLVRHWDGVAWSLVQVSIDDKLLTKELQAIAGAETAPGKHDIWIVGRDIAMFRSEGP